VFLSLTKDGLQQLLDLLHIFCQTWALTVNLSKNKIMVFQKRSSRQDHKYKLHLDTFALEHTKNDTYLGLNISANGNFHKAVNNLRDKDYQKEHKILHTN
jgi:predicted lipase